MSAESLCGTCFISSLRVLLSLFCPEFCLRCCLRLKCLRPYLLTLPVKLLFRRTLFCDRPICESSVFRFFIGTPFCLFLTYQQNIGKQIRAQQRTQPFPENLLHWEYLPVALAPDEAYDRDGCFSGSAVTMDDKSQLLMYTGVLRERHRDGGFREVQTQCMAVGDGIDYEKYENNPILGENDLPEGCSRNDFLDPKM